MAVYQLVRALQAWARKHKNRFLRLRDLAWRDAVQYANDYTFCNPAPDKLEDTAACEQWAARWLESFEKGKAR